MMTPRRRFLAAGLSGFAAFAARNGQGSAWGQAVERGARKCVILWMDGGPSQLETFDPKPGAATGGPTRAIATATPDLQICEHLPELAQRMSELCVIRSLTSREGEHNRAKYLQHTGFVPIPAFPRPELGSLVAHERHHGDLPGFVSIGGPGYGSAFLGPSAAPFAIDDPEAAIRLLKQLRSSRGRFELLVDLAAEFRRQVPAEAVSQREARIQRVQGLLETRLPELLDIELEPAESRQRYGDGEFARHALLARRLLEGGVACVEVQLGGWDTHQGNFTATRRLCQQFDKPAAALIDDLKSSGLWEETLLVWMGDFGRTPRINGQSGRDHYPAVSNVVLGGGGVAGGRVIGRTDDSGNAIVDAPLGVADLFATILKRLGVAPDKSYQTSFGSPTTATDDGVPIAGL